VTLFPILSLAIYTAIESLLACGTDFVLQSFSFRALAITA